MPQKKSAKKELRKSAKLVARNSLVTRNIKETIKDITKAVEAGDMDKATASFKKLQKAVDKAAKSGILKKNSANRKKTRAAKKIRSVAKK